MIALCPNPFRDAGLSKTGECRALLSEAGYETCVCPVFTGSEWQPPEKMTVCSIREVLPQLTHVVVLGGDGTILAVVRELDGAETAAGGTRERKDDAGGLAAAKRRADLA